MEAGSYYRKSDGKLSIVVVGARMPHRADIPQVD